MSDSIPEIPAEAVPPEQLLAERLRNTSSVPAPCTDEELAAADFSRRDVLIGTVRSDAQFDYTLASLSYYAPVKAIRPSDLPVRLVALYEEGLTRRPGIKRYGEVVDTRVVKREDIPVPMTRPNGEEAYYLFTVRAWVYLEHPLAIEGTARGRPAFTTEFLLTHARRSYQLVCIRSAAEYRLASALCALCEDALGENALEKGEHADGHVGSPPVFRRIGEQYLLGAAEGMLSLIHARGEVLLRLPLRAMQTEPAMVVDRLAAELGLRDTPTFYDR